MYKKLKPSDILKEGDEIWNPRWAVHDCWQPVPSHDIGRYVGKQTARRRISCHGDSATGSKPT